jgi:hypothetical protein
MRHTVLKSQVFFRDIGRKLAAADKRFLRGAGVAVRDLFESRLPLFREREGVAHADRQSHPAQVRGIRDGVTVKGTNLI